MNERIEMKTLRELVVKQAILTRRDLTFVMVTLIALHMLELVVLFIMIGGQHG